MKQILCALMLVFSAFASDFLPPEQAFKPSVSAQAQASVFRVDLGEQIYLYKDKLHAYLDGEEITPELELAGFVEHDEQLVKYDFLEFLLPNILRGESFWLDFQGCSEAGLCYQPLRASFRYENGWKFHSMSEPNDADSASDEGDEERFVRALSSGDFLSALALFAGFGLLLSFTPCVLPMLPILSGILAKKSGSHAFFASVIYVLFMALAYAALGVAAALAGGSFAAILQHPLMQLAFAALFAALACSCFGLFELKMPGKIQQFARFGERAPGLLGAAIMGVLSALLVGPCVAAPLAGALVYIASAQDVLKGGAALFALGLGMGAPLMALGAGFGLLKTGAWMMRVNRFFGFVLLGVAVYFAPFSEAVSFVLYGLILCAVAADFGFFRRPSGRKQLAGWLVLCAFLAASQFALYKAYARAGEVQGAKWEQISDDAALSRALQNGKKSLLYFTADWCENCQVYHEEVFPAAENELSVYNLLKIDLTNPGEFEKNLEKKYQVFGPPVIIKFDENGEFSRKITGLKKSDEFKKILKN